MNPKVKKKIGGMAKKSRETYPETAAFHNHIAGATPWAEWCERFEKTIQEHNDMWKTVGGGDGCAILNKTLKEYRQWIENING